MSKFKVTFTGDELVVARLKALGAWPYPLAGVAFDEKTVHECDDLAPFCSGNLPPGTVISSTQEIARYDAALCPWFIVETLTPETHGTQPPQI